MSEETTGYEYASAKLLRTSGADKSYLQTKLEEAKTFGKYSQFDMGVAQAINDWCKLITSIKEDAQ